MLKKVMKFFVVMSFILFAQAPGCKVFGDEVVQISNLFEKPDQFSNDGCGLFCNYNAAKMNAQEEGKFIIMVFFSHKPTQAMCKLRDSGQVSLGNDAFDQLLNIVLLQPGLIPSTMYGPKIDTMLFYMQDYLEKFQQDLDGAMMDLDTAYIVPMAVTSCSEEVLCVLPIPHEDFEQMDLVRMLQNLLKGSVY